jgi:hypothetical protein
MVHNGALHTFIDFKKACTKQTDVMAVYSRGPRFELSPENY